MVVGQQICPHEHQIIYLVNVYVHPTKRLYHTHFNNPIDMEICRTSLWCLVLGQNYITKGLTHMAWFTSQHGHFLRLSLPEQDLTCRTTVREAFTVAKQVLGGALLIFCPGLKLVPILDRHLRMKPASITLWGYHIYHQMGIPQLLDH